MDLLPVSISLPLTWCLCAMLMIYGLRLWYLAQSDAVRIDLLFASGRAAHREKLSAMQRLDRILDRQRDAVFQVSDQVLIVYDSLRALRRAFVVVPLAVVAAKAATDDRIFGIFEVFSGQPTAAERVGRALLVILVFAVTVQTFPRFASWAAGVQAKGRHVGFLFPILLVFPLQFSGMTKPLALYLALSLAVCCVWTLPKVKDSLSPEARALGQAAYLFALAVGSLILLVPLYLLFGSFSGLIAVVLLLGLILPLSIAPAILVALVAADRMVERVINKGYGRWGLPGLAVKAVCFAGLSLVLLGLGLVFALWLLDAIGPAGYRPDVGGSLTGLSTAAPFASLAAVTLLPLLVVPVTALAETIREYSPAMRNARAHLHRKDAPETDIVRALVWSRLTGWTCAVLLLGLPVLFLLGQAGVS